MGISGNALAFIGGAAEQFAENKQGFKKELRDNKRKQKEWLNTQGSKALEETKQQQESVELALDELEARGLKTPDALQLLQRHGVNAVLELNKTVKDYESANSTTVDADLMNKIWKAAEDFTPTSQSFEEAVSKVFGTNKAGSTAPVIQESEERGFFDKIKANLSGAYEDEEYDDFLNDASEGMGGYTINELRAMSASSLSMVGSDGAAVFDRSALRGSDSSPSDRDQWKTVRSDIVLNALMGLSEGDRENITTNKSGDAFTSRSTQDQFALLKINHPEVLAEATRKVGGSLSENPAAWTAYGGQDALNAILNPPPPPEPLTPEEKAEQLEQDLIDNNLTENRPEDLGEATDAQVGEYFRDNNKDFVISNGQLIGRPDEAPFDESKVVIPVLPTDYDENTFELKMQPTTKPEGVTAKPVVETNMLGGMSQEDRKKLSDWNRDYGGKFNDNGTYKLVRPRPIKPTNFDELERDEKGRITNEIRKWDRLYKDTHNPETGYPDLEDLDMTLIPNSEATD